MLVRSARAEEFAAIGELTVVAYSDFTEGESDFYVAKLRDAARRAREAELLVASDAAGTLLGTVTYCPSGSAWREVAGPDEGEFRMLAVHPSARGLGVGDALVSACLARAAEDGLRAVVLGSLPEMYAAHRIYSRLGFTRVPDRDFSPVEGVHLLAFRRPIVS